MRQAAALRAEAMDVSDRWVEAGSDPANPLLAEERALLVRSYAALLAAVHASGGRQQLPGVHDPGRVEPLLRRPDQVDARASPTSARIQGAWSRPIAWWWVIVPPFATIASQAAVLAARHCSSSAPGLLAGQEGEVERRARAVQVRDVAHHQRRRAALGERLAQRVADRRVERRQVAPGGGGLERLDEHAVVEQRVAQVGPGVAAAQPRLARPRAPAHSPPPRAQQRAACAAGAARRRPSSPSQPTIARQPPSWPRMRR